ncbi:MAG TPA: SDR family oxidoreductase [Polyangia bacterium]|nr:SDR family oxidoreductase [Polyangia bacterium]
MTSTLTSTTLSGKVALVTGASSGIGLSVARKLADAGARVAMVARTHAKLDEAVAQIGGGRAAAFPADVSDFVALARLPASVVERFGGLDILVNNAGVNHRGPIMGLSAPNLAEIVTTNLAAPIFLTRVAAEVLRAGGAIVNVASLAGMVPVHHEAAYCASKAGLRAFTRAVAEELHERGVSVSSVCPGPVDTNFFGDVAAVPDLVFSQPMSSADQVADAVMRCIVEHTAEISIPAVSGKLATLGYLFPSLMRALRPALERRGAKAKLKYLARKHGG